MNTEAVARRCFVKKVFLNISQSSQENTCVRVPFVIKLQAWSLKSTSSLKERLWYRCFPVNLRRLFLQNTSGGCLYEQWLQFHIWFIMTLYYKMWQILQSATTILLQNSTNVSHKMPEVFYFITKCNSYYKMLQYTILSGQMIQITFSTLT